MGWHQVEKSVPNSDFGLQDNFCEWKNKYWMSDFVELDLTHLFFISDNDQAI